MIRKTASLFFAAATAFSMTGCTTSDRHSEASTPSLAEPPQHLSESGDPASLVYLAAQTLADRAEGLDKARPIVVATVVSVDDMKASSTFGRLASEWIANRVEQRGYLVRDVTYTGALTINREGTLVLSRDALALSRQIGAQAIVAGTYAVAGEKIYLSLRLLSAHSGELISSTDVAIPLNDDTRPLVEASDRLVPIDAFKERASR
jgi:TolB-like protein